MGARSNRKGKVWERDVAQLMRDNGHPEARRGVLQSRGADGTAVALPDPEFDQPIATSQGQMIDHVFRVERSTQGPQGVSRARHRGP